MLDQAVEVIRKRVDYFGGGEPIISPVSNDRILVEIPGLDTAKIQEARDQLEHRHEALDDDLVLDHFGASRAAEAGVADEPARDVLHVEVEHRQRVALERRVGALRRQTEGREHQAAQQGR